MRILVDDWKQAWRWWSVRFAVLVGAGAEVAYRLAEVAETLMPALSQPVLDNLPPSVRAGAAVIGLVAVTLRLWRQGKPVLDDADKAGA